MIVSNQCKRMLNEAAVAYFDVLPGILNVDTE
jgi:hypothetical protein